MSTTELNATVGDTAGRRGPLVLVIGFCLFATAQISLTVSPLLERPNPPWPADAYMYMVKAKQIRDCFLQDCAAMESTRRQLTAPSDDPDMRTTRDRQYHRSLYQYHLLHSILLERLERLTGDWQIAYLGIAMAGGVAITLAVTGFVVAVFGPAAGGLGLALLSTTVFPGFHGIHWIVPSNITLAFGLLAWTLLLRRHAFALPALPILALAMVTMHTVGQIYAGTAILIAAYTSFRRGFVPWVFIGASGLVLVANALAPSLIERPALSLLREQLPQDISWWQAIVDNVVACWEHASEFGSPFHGPGALICLMILGLLAMRGQRRADATFIVILFGGLCVAGALYVMPHYPAEVFRRVWIPFVLFASGAVGALGCRVAQSVRDLLRDRHRYGDGFAGVFVLTALVFGGGAATILSGIPDVMTRYVALRTGSVFELDQTQPGRVLATVDPDQGAVYMNEVPMYVYLLHGWLDREAIYFPAIEGSPEARVLREEAARFPVAIAVHASPYLSFTNGIWLPQETTMVIETGVGTDWSSGAVRVMTRTKPVKLAAVFEWPSGRIEEYPIDAPAGQFTWIDLPSAPGATRLMLVHVAGGFSRLAGIRLEAAASTTWPWDRGLTVIATPAEDSDETEIRFNSQDLVPPECESDGIIDDTGATIVVSLRCGATNRD